MFIQSHMDNFEAGTKTEFDMKLHTTTQGHSRSFILQAITRRQLRDCIIAA